MDQIVKERQNRRVKRKAILNESRCVACGSCVKVCPREAITIQHGVFASISEDLCVGCGKCVIACPASIIKLKERDNEEK